jgi:Flp pilus assembly protein TadG
VWRRCRGAGSEQDGAVAIIVALCLVAVMAMVVLTVDVGALLVRRRSMVNGADAAALAAAKSCFGVEDSDVPGDLADQYAVDNSTGLAPEDGGIVPGETRNCDNGKSGHVTVRYQQAVSLAFAPVLGLDDSGDVTTKATASWGATGAASPIPLVLNAGAFQGPCKVPDVPVGTTCFLWYDNSLFGGSAFGFLDIKYPGGWDVTATDNCNNAGGANQLQDWIKGIGVGSLHLNYPSHTYVCVDGGLRGQVSTAVWGEITKLIGLTRDFPINGVSPADNAVQVMKNGQVDKYNIIGFAQMRIENVLSPADAGGSPGIDDTCTRRTNSALSGGAGAGTFFPWSVFGNSNGCPGSTVPNAVDSVVLGTLRSGVDYVVTNTGFTLKPGVTLPNHSDISFTWHVYPVPGAPRPHRTRAPDAWSSSGWGRRSAAMSPAAERTLDTETSACAIWDTSPASTRALPEPDPPNHLTLEHQVLSPISPIPLCKHG